jgi:16S rRNA processing protein RimM
VIGRFGRPRGVSGEIYVTPATDDPARFVDLREIIIVGSGRRKTVSLERAAVIGGRPVIKIEGIDSREEVAKLTGLSIEIPIELLRPLPDGSYYQFDLIGCRVAGVDGTDYGVIEEVMFYPASDLYRIVSKRYGEVLFPAVDRYIIRIDIDGKKIIIDPPAGLFVPREETN